MNKLAGLWLSWLPLDFGQMAISPVSEILDFNVRPSSLGNQLLDYVSEKEFILVRRQIVETFSIENEP